MSELQNPGFGPDDNEQFQKFIQGEPYPEYLRELPPIPVRPEAEPPPRLKADADQAWQVAHGIPVVFQGQSLEMARFLISSFPESKQLRSQALFPERLAPPGVEVGQALNHWGRELELPTHDVEIARLTAFQYFVEQHQRDPSVNWDRHIAEFEIVRERKGWFEAMKNRLAPSQSTQDDVARQAQYLARDKTLQGLVLKLELPTWGKDPIQPLAETRTFQISVRDLIRSLNRLTSQDYRIHLENFRPDTRLTDSFLMIELAKVSDALNGIESTYVATQARRTEQKAMQRYVSSPIDHQDRCQILARVHWAIEEHGIAVNTRDPVE